MGIWKDVNAIYQIYPRSFKDSNGDGVGDLPGIIEKLDYLKQGLGVDALWLSPFYKSPMVDFGYDISDHYDVDPSFGVLDDYRKLLREAHARDIKVMADFVPNHTSDQHEWFVESRSSRQNPKRDWYVWRDPKPDGSPPNNWLSVFGGSAWELDPMRGQYYLHSFSMHQPDLNWENPAVRSAMHDVMAFWLALGTDGIRLDAVRWISKDILLRDNPPNPNYDPDKDPDPYHIQLQTYSYFGPRLFEYLQELILEGEFKDRVFIFEDYPDTESQIDPHVQRGFFYTQINRNEAMPFNFEGMSTEWGADSFRKFVDDFEQSLRGNDVAVYCFGNHDKPRLASRYGLEKARLIAMLQLTLPGLPVVYYGDELGMLNGDIHGDAIQDPFEKQVPGVGLGRDIARTPMQWSDEPHAGFSTAEPWLPVPQDLSGKTVASQETDKGSIYSLYRRLLALRHGYSCLRHGTYEKPEGNDDKVFAYTCRDKMAKSLVVLNFSDVDIEYAVGDYSSAVSTTAQEPRVDNKTLKLGPYEGAVFLEYSDEQ